MTDSLILQAASFARLAHGNQVRKYSGLPYYTHPARVAGRVSAIPEVTAIEIAAANLHDTIEDTPVTKEDLLQVFPEQVVVYVCNLTDVFTKKAFPHLNRQARRELEYERLSELDIWSRKIKLADRIDNLRDMSPIDDFYHVYKKESEQLLFYLKGSDMLLEAELAYLVKRNFKTS